MTAYPVEWFTLGVLILEALFSCAVGVFVGWWYCRKDRRELQAARRFLTEKRAEQLDLRRKLARMVQRPSCPLCGRFMGKVHVCVPGKGSAPQAGTDTRP